MKSRRMMRAIKIEATCIRHEMQFDIRVGIIIVQVLIDTSHIIFVAMAIVRTFRKSQRASILSIDMSMMISLTHHYNQQSKISNQCFSILNDAINCIFVFDV